MSFSGATHSMHDPPDWKKVRGLATATVASLLRIGWKLQSPTQWEDLFGHCHDIDKVRSKSIASNIRRDTRIGLWKKLGNRDSSYASLEGRPWLEPIQRLLNKKDTHDWHGAHKGMLKAIVSSGLWPAQRLHDAGYITDGLCTCGAPQTVKHILFSCPLTRSFRTDWGLSLFLQNRIRATPDSTLWSIGLVQHPLQ